MRKIMFFLITIFMFAGLFGQGIETKNPGLVDLIDALEKNGFEEYEIQILPEDVEKTVEEAVMTIDEFIEYIETLSIQYRFVYMTDYVIHKYCKKYGYFYVWDGLFKSTGSVTAGDYDGIYHYVQYLSQEPFLKQFTDYPINSRIASCASCTGSHRACGQPFTKNLVTLPELGTVVIRVPYGAPHCMYFDEVSC
ncbi:MAG: hypothetical protein ACOX2F_08625 [bacterium]